MTGPLGPVRATLRLAGLFVVSTVTVVSWLVPAAVRPFSRRAASRIRHRQMSAWARSALFLMGVRVESDGPPPPPGSLLVSNHLSYLDVLVLWSRVPATFVSKAEVRHWPVLGWAVTAAGTLYLERERRTAVKPMVDAVAERLALGETVVFFPEGTSSPGQELLPFRPSLFEAARAVGGRVHVASLAYATDDPTTPASETVAWWGDAPFAAHFLGLLTLPRVRARLRFAPTPVEADDRKEISRLARHAMEAIFEPMTPPRLLAT